MQQEPLHKIIEPETVSFWPPQPGWYVVLAVLVVLLIIAIVKWKKHRKKTKYKRDAIKSIEGLNFNSSNSVGALNKVLKYVAIVSYGRENVADLFGDKWLVFLSTTQDKYNFSEAPFALIGKAQFELNSNESLDQNQWAQLKTASQYWVKAHKKKTSNSNN